MNDPAKSTSPRANRAVKTGAALALATAAVLPFSAHLLTPLPLTVPVLVAVVLVGAGIAWAASPRGSSLSVALAATAITALLAGGTAIATFGTTTHQAYTKGYIKVQMSGDASPYYIGVADKDVPRDPESAADPVVKQFLSTARKKVVAPPGGPGAPPTSVRPTSSDHRTLVLPTKAHVDQVVWNPTQAGRLTYVASSTLPPTLIALAAFMVLRIMRQARAGDPFSPTTARTLTALGWLLAIGLPIQELVRVVAAELALGSTYGTVGTMADEADWYFSFASVLPGILVLALARIWREGVQLREIDRTTV